MVAALGSSAITYTEPKFDLKETIEKATEFGFNAVQLYLSSKIFCREYYLELIEQIKQTNLKVVIHLPDLKDLTDQDRDDCKLFQDELPGQVRCTLIHYVDDMLPEMIPVINGKRVAIENAKNRVFDMDYIMQLRRFTIFCDVPMVFDYGRLMYPKNEKEISEILWFIGWFITYRLSPEKDVIHAADKLKWYLPFRECWAALGDPDGVGYTLLEALQNFSDKGGVVVCEQEDYETATKSREAFRD